MNEIFPTIGGLLLGRLLFELRPRIRWGVGAILTLIIGAVATWASHEFLLGWQFLCVDVSIVSVSAAAGFVASARRRSSYWKDRINSNLSELFLLRTRDRSA